MLVLTRFAGEKIVIDDGRIVVTVIAVRGGAVKVGIDAPKDVQVHREEVWLRRDPPNPKESA